MFQLGPLLTHSGEASGFSKWWGRVGTPRSVGYRMGQQGGHRWKRCSLIGLLVHFSFIHSFIVSVRYFSNIRDTRKNKLLSSASVTYSLDLSVSLCEDNVRVSGGG